jgi:hypothetical protein
MLTATGMRISALAPPRSDGTRRVEARRESRATLEAHPIGASVVDVLDVGACRGCAPSRHPRSSAFMKVQASSSLKWALLASAATALLAGCGEPDDPIAQAEKQDAEKPGAIAIKDTVEEAYIYAFPMLMNYGVMHAYFIDRDSGQYKAPFNTIYNEARVFTYEDTAIVTPNSDTPYSFVGMDLRAEPIVLCVPEIEKSRYYDVQLVDLYTFNYGYIGSRATGNAAGCFAVAGPDWRGETPAGIEKVFHSETQFGLAGYRTQLFGPGDMPNVEKIQAGYTVQTLSQFLKQPAPPAAPVIDWPSFGKQDMKAPFAQYLNFLLQFCPPVEQEKALRARFATIGIEAGRPFAFDALSDTHKAEYLLAIEEGYARIEHERNTFGKLVNGWLIGSILGDRAFFHGNWLLRAAGALAGIYGNSAEEAVYPLAKHDANGAPLDGSKHDYTLTFAAGEFPPVNAFWSVTMYDGKTQLLIENPIDRYLINSPMLPELELGSDGSLTIYMQKDSPGTGKESNWLPAPDGPIYLVMRLYWPKTEPPSVLPPGDGTWKPPAIVPSK